MQKRFLCIFLVTVICLIPAISFTEKADSLDVTVVNISPERIDPLKIITTISSAITAMLVIFGFANTMFKKLRKWTISKVRKLLDMPDIESRLTTIDERHASAVEDRRKQYEIMSGQNQALEDSLRELTQKIDTIAETVRDGRDCDRTIIRDRLTQSYYRYCRLKRIPIHERENMEKMFDAYVALGGNSYVKSIMEDMRHWEVINPQEGGCNAGRCDTP